MDSRDNKVSLIEQKTLKSLILSSKNGDEQAFHLLYQRLNDPFFKYILSRTKDRDDAMDILQEVFIDLWKAFQTFQYNSDAQFYGFAFTIIKRKLEKHYKKPRSYDELDENSLEFSDTPDMERADDIRVLMTAIGGLKERDRTVIELHYWSGLTFGEIGKLINDKETTVKVRHHRALKLLESLLNKKEIKK
jgi:RNA polymerase sigma-70 factor (ECF subfamily)